MVLFLTESFLTPRSGVSRSSSPSFGYTMDTEMTDSVVEETQGSTQPDPPVASTSMSAFGSRWLARTHTPLLTSAHEFMLPMQLAHSAPPSPSPLGTSSSGDEVNPFGLTGIGIGIGSVSRHARRTSAGVRGLAAAAGITSGAALSHQRSASTSSATGDAADMLGLDPVSRSRPRSPSTPPRRRASISGSRKVSAASQGTKLQPRLQHLRLDASLNLVEYELKMEAHFQRLLSNVELTESALPALHSPRPVKVNRGRFPEEVRLDDEPARQNEQDSDEEEPVLEQSGSSTSVAMSFIEDRAMSEDSSSILRASPAISLMDLDQPIHLSGSNGGSSNGTGTPRDAWRHTPPPTSNNGSRVNKRKFAADERYEPYAYPPAKRRAASPAIGSMGMPSPLVIPRSPVIRPIAHSLTSSPVFARPQVQNVSVPMSLNSSPILRPSGASIQMMSSPVMRPIVRLRASAANNAAAASAGVPIPCNGVEHAVEGAGDGVGGLTLR